MAMELKKEMMDKLVKPSGSKNEIASLVGGFTDVLKELGNVTKEARGLLHGYTEIKSHLVPQQKGISTQAVRQPQRVYEDVAPAVRPAPAPAIALEPVPVVDNFERAESIFNEIHEILKPQIPLMENVSALQVFQTALIPENRQKIIAFIASRL